MPGTLLKAICHYHLIRSRWEHSYLKVSDSIISHQVVQTPIPIFSISIKKSKVCSFLQLYVLSLQALYKLTLNGLFNHSETSIFYLQIVNNTFQLTWLLQVLNIHDALKYSKYYYHPGLHSHHQYWQNPGPFFAPDISFSLPKDSET